MSNLKEYPIGIQKIYRRNWRSPIKRKQMEEKEAKWNTGSHRGFHAYHEQQSLPPAEVLVAQKQRTA